MKKLLILTAVVLSFVGCSEEDEQTYPPMITEMAVMSSDASGTIRSFTTDAGNSYSLTTPYTGVTENALWRFLVGYVADSDGRATVYSLEGVVVPRDSTSRAGVAIDPVGFVSAWPGGGFVNMHLQPKTKGGVHTWGYVRDSLTTNTAGGSTHFITLFHRQGNDPMAYSAEAYVSIPVDSLSEAPGAADSICLTVKSFSGTIRKSFAFSR